MYPGEWARSVHSRQLVQILKKKNPELSVKQITTLSDFQILVLLYI